MGYVTALFPWKVIQQVDDRIDKDAALGSLGIDPKAPIDPSLMVRDTEYYDFLERLAREDQNGKTIPLKAGESMRCDDYGAFGLAWKSAINLRGSYDRAQRYARVLTSVSTYQVEQIEGGALMHLHREGERRLGMRLSNEATIASIVSISRQVSTAEFNPVAIYFKHAAPEDISEHEAYFNCPVKYHSSNDALLVSKESLETPNHLGDTSISKFFESHLESEVSKLESSKSLDHQVRVIVSRSLSEGVPHVPDVAKQMAMSARTLQRRLSEQGYSFQTLVDESRRKLAERLVKETDYTLAEVAFMTGFSEQSAFTRAFRRWKGQSPRSYRLKSNCF
ncbi:MAG: AraC family transcriptional regulator [Verrucomicrobiota bacterium]